MNHLYTLKSKLFSTSSVILLGGLILAWSPFLNANKIDQITNLPIRISPIPNVPNQDPVVANLEAVMDDFFQQPFFPGGIPYLDPIVLSYNTFLGGELAINPTNNKIIVTTFAQNNFRDLSGTFYGSSLTSVLGFSSNGGKTWNYGPPVEQTISLGGTISQIVGFSPIYAKNGTLYAIGEFFDTHPNIPNALPMQGILFSLSHDNGNTWEAPTTIVNSQVDSIFTAATGVGLSNAVLLPDPQDADHIHVGFSSVVLPTTYYGSIFYTHSHHQGRHFHHAHEIYNIANDPEWQALHFDAALITDPPSNQSDFYPLYGGQAIITDNFVVVDKDVILLPILRTYPPQGLTTYTQSPANTYTDRGVLRSHDNGESWSHIARVAQQTIFALAHDPAGASPSDYVFLDGSLNQPTVYSPITGRVYMAYMAGNTSASSDPLVQQYFPRIVLNTSTDHGGNWSPAVQINATPLDISTLRQQALQPSMAISQDGYVVVAYYDFRNWTGSPLENRLTTPLNVDAWLAVYKETQHHDGGSTGVGLDFVEEIRLTPHSFNGRITLLTDSSNSIPGSNYNAAAPNGIGLAFNQNNELLVTFGMNNPELLPDASSITTGYLGVSLDPNNRSNVFLHRIKFPNVSNR
jgi:hypothetical protein